MTRELSPILKALSNPVRLELLELLQEPKAVAEIRLRPVRLEDGTKPRRPMNRVTIRQHLKQLIDIGAVKTVAGVREGRPVDLFVVAADEMFLLGQQLMSLGRVQVEQHEAEATRELDPEATTGIGTVGLALVNGVYEGQWFPLVGEHWTLGRDAQCDVALTFDPFISSLHAEIHRSGNNYTISGSPDAKNPLCVDWEALGPEDTRELNPGSVISMGRCTLVFRT